jgi:structural maintenance of chromosome 2
MKPVEILSMIEEAAGTKMFQRNKENAMKTIEKKQLKVDELSKCMDDEINPQLDHLREQQQHFIVYESNSNELDRLEHFSIASEYQGYQKIVDQNTTGKKAIEDEKTAMEITQQDKIKESEECAGKIEEMSALLKDEKKDEFTSLKKNEEDVSKELVKVKTVLKNHKETVIAEKETAIALERQVDGAKESLLVKEGELQKSEKELEKKEAVSR